MEAFGILGFIFGVVAFVRVEKLTKTLKEKTSWKRTTRKSRALP